MSLVLRNAEIVDVVAGSSRIGSIVVEGERIRAVGADEEVAALQVEGTQIIDLDGMTMVPGLIDAHAHMVETGLTLIEVDCREARSISEVLELILARASRQARGTLVRAWNLYENLLREGRFPTMAELDAVAPDHVVRVMREDGHTSVVNSKSFALLGYTTSKPGVESVGGSPTGVLRAQAQYDADRTFASFETPEMHREGLAAAAKQALEVGLTTVHALEGSDTLPHEYLTSAVSSFPALPIHTVLWYQTTHLARLEGMGLPRVGGCILTDGAVGSWTAAMFEPYLNKPDSRGTLYFSDEALHAFVLAAHRQGYQVALHAVGQRAVEQVLSVYERVLDAEPKGDHRLRIEHGHALPSRSQFERMANRGIILSTQPAFLHYKSDVYHSHFGSRWAGAHPHKMAIECGVTIAGGSDSYVTPLNPLLGVHCAVNHPVPEQRVDVTEALRWFTINAAFAGFEEKDRGSIAAGKIADLTVLGRNPLTSDPATIKDIPVVMTIVAGKICHTSKDARLSVSTARD